METKRNGLKKKMVLILLEKILKFIFHYFRAWSLKIPRTHQVHYNPYTQTVEVLNTQSQIVNVVKNVKADLDCLHSALKKLD